jgi:23S rRNA pseudouridine2605 synthase
MTSRDPFVLPGDEPPSGEKIQKFLSASGVSSRRHAETLVMQGRVTVNGEVARLGMRVDPEDRVCVNGVEVGPQAPRLYIVNKPTKFVTTLDDPQGRKTVADLVPDDVRVYPVGRLDYDTSGLLLMTNDGELAHRLMHPSFGVEKTYRALVEGNVPAKAVRQLCEGVDIGDGDGVTSPAKVRVVDSHAGKTILELIIHEGKNRQVRRMCEVVGHPVVELVRVGYGPLGLGGLAVGSSRPLTEQETRRIRKAAGLAPPRRASDDEKPSRAERRAADRELEAKAAAAATAAGSEQEAVETNGKADAKHSRNRDDKPGAKQRGASGARGAAAKPKPKAKSSAKPRSNRRPSGS